MISSLCLAIYIAAWFTAQNPKDGTLEWVWTYEKPRLSRLGIFRALKWTDIFWTLGAVLLPVAAYVGLCAAVDPSILSAALSNPRFFLTAAPVALLAGTAYLLGKLLSGYTSVGILTAAFAAVSGVFGFFLPVRHMAAVSAVTVSLVLLLVFYGGRGFGRYAALALSAGTLLGASWLSSCFFWFFVPWALTVLAGEILRVKEEEAPVWGLILTVLLALVPPALALYDGGFRRQVLTLPAEGLHLSDLPLLLAGAVVAVGGLCRRQAGALPLLFWSVCTLPLALFWPDFIALPGIILALGFLLQGIRGRGYGFAAWVVGLVPTLFVIFTWIILVIL